MKEHEQIHKEM